MVTNWHKWHITTATGVLIEETFSSRKQARIYAKKHKIHFARIEPEVTEDTPPTSSDVDLALSCITLGVHIMSDLHDLAEEEALRLLQMAVLQHASTNGFAQASEIYLPEGADKAARMRDDADRETALDLAERFLNHSKDEG